MHTERQPLRRTKLSYCYNELTFVFRCTRTKLSYFSGDLTFSFSDAKADIFSRLKALEERILFLEGLSLEYFRDGVCVLLLSLIILNHFF